MSYLDFIIDGFVNSIYWFPWLSFFNDLWLLEFLLVYNLYLMFLTINIYYTLLYLFIEIVLFGVFISLYQMELFTGFLWVVEGSVIFVALLLLFYLNVEGLIVTINLQIYKFFFFIGIFFFFILFFNFSFLNSQDNLSINIILNYYDLYDDFYESIFNKNSNDFLVLFISYYSINSVEFMSIGLLLLIGSVICVQLNKLQKNIKIESLSSYFSFYKFFTDVLDFFFLRRQNLTNQTNQISSLRIFKRKKNYNFMILKFTKLIPLDKCGVWEVKTFHLYGGFYVKKLKSGGFIKVSIKKTKPNNWVSKGSKSKGIIVYNAKSISKTDGSTFKLKYNSIILLKKRLTPKGKEVFGPSLFFIRRKKFINSFVGIL